ncbi:MAG: glutamine synthetase type III [Clostridia bacterium]|nr:glutamine synthetase type III [Clostridia bacterium]NLS86055.1 glutamine synthetase type III [Oscillospiraceae bacterium]
MSHTQEIFGSMVFNDHVMKERLPSATYKSLHETVRRGAPLNVELANVVANAMKDWSIEHGATHYTHWFQPLTGVTSEKHDSFISPTKDGRVIMEFSGKELVQGEPDASSFPSGGLRATCEARGYTAWDPTSYAFIKDDVLCIPTAFCSYSGEVLDEKTPLLRSMAAISTQACRILKLFGQDVPQVTTTVGPEQEYFLVDSEQYLQREDLRLCGRTLFGAMPPKGQELDDHYFGVLKPRVSEYMKQLDDELWKLGIAAKTKHNEVAPSQHELAPIFSTTNIAVDHNQLTMEIMKKVATRLNLACLLHEKPFDGVNGSGKHNNWSISSPTANLLDPGKTPMDNLQFLLFLAAVIKAVDQYQDLLRVTVASAGNDHRLGANEAPPAIISIFVGEELEGIIDAIASGTDYVAPLKAKMELGVEVLPTFSKDTTDRNRTSPFAFTGNKFEFRMPGSAQSIADANIVLNTAVAKELKGYADELEGAKDFDKAVIKLVKRTIKDHKRVIFNGNGYTDEWEKEAAERGLYNLKSTAEALPCMIADKNVALFEEFGIFSKAEVKARYEVHIENYVKTLHIEALTMLDMAKKQIVPSVSAYMGDIAGTACSKKAVSEAISCKAEEALLIKLSAGADAVSEAIDTLEAAVNGDKYESLEEAVYYKEHVLPAMAKLRAAADGLETICGKDYWPFPTYSELLFSVN